MGTDTGKMNHSKFDDYLNAIKRREPAKWVRAPRGTRLYPSYSTVWPLNIELLATSDDVCQTELKRTLNSGDDIKNQNTNMLQKRGEKESELAYNERVLGHLTKNMVELNREKFNEKKRCQQLHETSVELRDLKQQLDKAAVILNLISQREEVGKSIEQERLEGLQEAQKIRELAVEEKKAVLKNKKMKQQSFRNGILEQIRDHKIEEAERLQKTARDHERMLEMGIEYKNKLDQEKADVYKRKMALKEELDTFLRLDREIKAARNEPDVPDVGILECLQERTKKYLNDSIQKRIENQKRRELLSIEIGRQIREVEDKRLGREEFLTDLLVQENKVKQDKLYKKSIDKELKTTKNHYDLLKMQYITSQLRRENEREKERFVKLPSDPTCFHKRQYRLYDAYVNDLDVRNKQCYNTIWKMIEDNRIRRAEVKAERQHIEDEIDALHRDRERRIAKERELLLNNSTVEVLATLRDGVLTEEEIARYNVPRRERKEFVPFL